MNNITDNVQMYWENIHRSYGSKKPPIISVTYLQYVCVK